MPKIDRLIIAFKIVLCLFVALFLLFFMIVCFPLAVFTMTCSLTFTTTRTLLMSGIELYRRRSQHYIPSSK